MARDVARSSVRDSTEVRDLETSAPPGADPVNASTLDLCLGRVKSGRPRPPAAAPKTAWREAGLGARDGRDDLEDATAQRDVAVVVGVAEGIAEAVDHRQANTTAKGRPAVDEELARIFLVERASDR